MQAIAGKKNYEDAFEPTMITGMKNEFDSNDMARAFDQLTRCRRSIRGFLSDEVEQATLDRIFETAAYAPSNCNTQPWHVYVASGDFRHRLSELLLASIGEGKYSLDFPYDAKYSDIYRQRQLDVGLMLYKALGITREDKEGKRQAFLRNLEFFGAAHVAFIFMPEWCGIREAADVGMYAQNLMLAMQAHGVASCPQTILSYNADLVRDQFDIDASFKLLFGISFGYEDKSLPENQIVPDRACLAESVHFHR